MKGNGGLEVAYTPSWILHINSLIYVATVASSHNCMLFVLTTLNIKFCDLKLIFSISQLDMPMILSCLTQAFSSFIAWKAHVVFDKYFGWLYHN